VAAENQYTNPHPSARTAVRRNTAILFCAIAAFGCVFFQAYSVQAVLLVFVAVRSSMLLLLNGTPEHQA
jgi:hypothetical protein